MQSFAVHVLDGHDTGHSIMNCTDIMNVSLPEPVNAVRLREILSSRAVLMPCIRQCKAVSPHDPPDSLYVHMDAGTCTAIVTGSRTGSLWLP